MIKKLKEINIEFIKNNPEKRKEFSERLKKLWKQKNYKKLMSELKSKEMKKRWKNKDPSLRRFTSEESKKIWENKTHRKKRSEFTKKQWQKQEYKHKVITTKVLKQVNKLTKKHKKITPEIYDKEWINGLPKSKTALKYFNNFSDMIEQAKIYNHKIIRTEILEEKENVYDLTIDQTHNFALAAGVFVHNSIDGDPAAAQRYTEAKLNKIAEEMIGDIEKETVDFTPNFDGSLQEPLVLPSKIPNLLINGSTGIAVGMATNIPPHNLTEVCKATIKLIENPELSFEELIQELPGPDFPTGGIICGRNGILQAYKTGKGKVVIRAKHHFEETKNKKKIIITEIPYMVNKAQLLEQIADGVRDKTIEGITNLNDESDREGMRIVIDLKSGANEEVVLNQLYSHTRLQDTFGIIMLALDNYKPKVMPVKDVISKFITHRQNIVTRRTKYELKKAEEKAHILEGLIIALNNIDKVISLIKSTKKTEDAKNELMTVYSLTEIQAKSILEMRLQRLTGLEQEKINTEHTELLKIISELKELLSTEHNILNVVKKELKEIQEKYGDTRRSTISNEEITEIDLENLIEPEETVISLSNTGYVKRLSIDNYKQQKRGGKGVVGAGTKEEDFIQEIFVANTHDYLLVFTNQGKVHWLKVYEIPESGRYAKGSSIVNLLKLQKDETVMTAIPIKEFNKDNYLLMSTKKGLIKKTSLEDFSKPRKGGIIALTLEENDELIRVLLTDGTKQILIATEFGQAIRFNENDIRNSGRTSKGVRGIRLRKEDNVVDCQVAEDDKIFLSITEKGYGKRTEVKEYRLINRGGKGVRNIKITPKNGKVVAAKVVKGDEDVMIMTEKGVMIRIPVKGISVVGRNSQGVRVMKLANEDKVTGAALIVE
ncbi:DNA gyrase subunit A [Candidatus Woesearchaeota archaeon CG10_big_fil_rev_8_21_14_0_10_30_7]|nr:MAG: DNA gyrase subunit A [Candidatus Woesearchaeota archaeon CG10_big_fil_rev_8_21_14_0_10_30_7]